MTICISANSMWSYMAGSTLWLEVRQVVCMLTRARDNYHIPPMYIRARDKNHGFSVYKGENHIVTMLLQTLLSYRMPQN